MKIYASVLVLMSTIPNLYAMENIEQKTANQLAYDAIALSDWIDLIKFKEALGKNDFDVNQQYKYQNGTFTLPMMISQYVSSKNNNSIEVFKLLLAKPGLNPHIQNSFGFDLLQSTILAEETTALEMLLKNKQELQLDVNRPAASQTALGRAIANRRYQHVALLLQQDEINPNIAAEGCTCPLRQILGIERSSNEETPTITEFDIMRLLAEAGADFNCKHDNARPFSKAITLYGTNKNKFSADRIIALIVNGAQFDRIFPQNSELEKDIIGALISKQKDTNMEVIKNAYKAACHGVTIRDTIIKNWQKNSLLNVQDAVFKMTPAMWAVVFGNVAMLKQLAKHGADLLVQDRWGYNALHLAVLHGNVHTAQYIMQQKPNTAIAKNMNGKNPVDLAIKLKKSNELLEVLYEETKKVARK